MLVGHIGLQCESSIHTLIHTAPTSVSQPIASVDRLHCKVSSCKLYNESLFFPGPSGQQPRFRAATGPGCGRHLRRFAGAPPTPCSSCEALRNLHKTTQRQDLAQLLPLMWRALPAKPKSERRVTQRSATSCHF